MRLRRHLVIMLLPLLLLGCAGKVEVELSAPVASDHALASDFEAATNRDFAPQPITNLYNVELMDRLTSGAAEHVDQTELLALVEAGDHAAAFEQAFEMGDELFETVFNAADGVGANIGNGARFSQLPRADLSALGEWASHTPRRITGPNAEACNDCHGEPFDDGAGRAANNNVRDPLHSGELSMFIQRNTPHVFAIGAVQVLAEEMTEELHRLRDEAGVRACAEQQPVEIALSAKGVMFGSIIATPIRTDNCAAEFDTNRVVGVNHDLVVQPFQWKGVNATVREFNRDAAHQELGMQSVETTGDDVDGDYDGVANELTVGDQTALAIYLAAQPRPTNLLELDNLGLIDPLTAAQRDAIARGSQTFETIGCAACHMPSLTMADPVFHEPSQNPNYRDETFPAGQDPLARGVDPAFSVRFDLTQDQPDNIVETDGGVYHLGAFATDAAGGGVAALYGDLRRHDIGAALAEPINDEGVPASVFLTENLWGVGSTAPYLHDGRASTLTEAIIAHGGEAEATRTAFIGSGPQAQADLIAFLENLVLFKMEEPAPAASQGVAAQAATVELTALTVEAPIEVSTETGQLEQSKTGSNNDQRNLIDEIAALLAPPSPRHGPTPHGEPPDRPRHEARGNR